jgi:erythromycin esterase-like protein
MYFRNRRDAGRLLAQPLAAYANRPDVVVERPSEQFDAVIHFDHTRAVEPLERTAEWERADLPVTYPVGV